jgi:hypothetical protein
MSYSHSKSLVRVGRPQCPSSRLSRSSRSIIQLGSPVLFRSELRGMPTIEARTRGIEKTRTTLAPPNLLSISPALHATVNSFAPSYHAKPEIVARPFSLSLNLASCLLRFRFVDLNQPARLSGQVFQTVWIIAVSPDEPNAS